MRAWRSLLGVEAMRTADHARKPSIAKMPVVSTGADARPAAANTAAKEKGTEVVNW